MDDDHNDAIFIVETVLRCLKIIDDTSKWFLNVIFVAGFWYLIDLGTGCFLTGPQKSYLSQRSARILDPGNSRRESASFFLARPREMIF